jgi:hypothetical protein
MYYVVDDSLYAYDLQTERAVLVVRGQFDDFSLSPRGGRIVFDREGEDGKTLLTPPNQLPGGVP